MGKGERFLVIRRRQRSIVLKDDIMLEIQMWYLPKPEAQFRPLVTKMLSRL